MNIIMLFIGIGLILFFIILKYIIVKKNSKGKKKFLIKAKKDLQKISKNIENRAKIFEELKKPIVKTNNKHKFYPYVYKCKGKLRTKLSQKMQKKYDFSRLVILYTKNDNYQVIRRVYKNTFWIERLPF